MADFAGTTVPFARHHAARVSDPVALGRLVSRRPRHRERSCEIDPQRGLH